MNQNQFKALEHLLVCLESQGLEMFGRQLHLALRTLRHYVQQETGRRRVKTYMLLDDYYPAQCKFSLGTLIVTQSAWESVHQAGRQIAEFIYRHAGGDWGECGAVDRNREYQQAVPLFSSYLLADAAKVWLITEADRSHTTILLPHEFDVLYAVGDINLAPPLSNGRAA